jgi:hypothetical protein
MRKAALGIRLTGNTLSCRTVFITPTAEMTILDESSVIRKLARNGVRQSWPD